MARRDAAFDRYDAAHRKLANELAKAEKSARAAELLRQIAELSWKTARSMQAEEARAEHERVAAELREAEALRKGCGEGLVG